MPVPGMSLLSRAVIFSGLLPLLKAPSGLSTLGSGLRLPVLTITRLIKGKRGSETWPIWPEVVLPRPTPLMKPSLTP